MYWTIADMCWCLISLFFKCMNISVQRLSTGTSEAFHIAILLSVAYLVKQEN